MCTAHAGHTQAFAVSGGAVLRMTVKCKWKPLFFVENSVVKSPPNSNRQTLAIIVRKCVALEKQKSCIFVKIHIISRCLFFFWGDAKSWLFDFCHSIKKIKRGNRQCANCVSASRFLSGQKCEARLFSFLFCLSVVSFPESCPRSREKRSR